MRLTHDLTGQRFERLVVLERAEDYVNLSNPAQRAVCWRCRCDCGKVVDVMARNLRSGATRSCGCLRREVSSYNARMRKARKRLAAAILALLLLVTTAWAEEPVLTERKGKGVEEFLWSELSEHSPSDYVTAAVLSYFWRESSYRSDSVTGWIISQQGTGADLCKTVTERTDEGLTDGSSRDYFLRKARYHGGYGLGQWYAMHYLEDLYDFAQEYGTSIGDARMQCAFVFHSMRQDEELWDRLNRCRDPEKAGRLVAIYYDGTVSGVEYIGYKAGRLFDKYHEEEG